MITSDRIHFEFGSFTSMHTDLPTPREFFSLIKHSSSSTRFRAPAAQPTRPSMTSSQPDRPTTKQPGWTWSWINLLLDAVLLIVFTVICFVAVVVRFVFPPGPAAAGWTLWGLDYDAWGGVQFGLLAVLSGGILVHVMLHWSWVCNVIASRVAGRGARVDDGLQTIYGVVLLIGLLAAVGSALAVAVITVQAPG